MAFHPYPQLIPRFFNNGGCGPPRDFTPDSSWPWIDHLVSGLQHATHSRCSHSVSLRLQTFQSLTSQHTVTRRSVLQKVRGRTFNSPSTACEHRVSGSISLPSRGAFHLSLTVLSTIGHQGVFSLGGWAPLLPTGFPVSRGTLEHDRLSLAFVYRIVTFSDGAFQLSSTSRGYAIWSVRNPSPVKNHTGLGYFPFARRYLGNRCFFLFLGVLRCFSSPGLPSNTYGFSIRYLRFALSGLPHSEIYGSTLACSSP